MEEVEEDCVDCSKVLSLEKFVGATGMIAGLLIVAFAADLLLGGKLAHTLDALFGREGADDE